jgi:hypothetical protein
VGEIQSFSVSAGGTYSKHWALKGLYVKEESFEKDGIYQLLSKGSRETEVTKKWGSYMEPLIR